MSKERQNEINFAINLIQEVCETAQICLIAKEIKGIKLVAIHDNVSNRDYAMKKVNKCQ